MPVLQMRALHPDYTSEVDSVDEHIWCQILQKFDDANIYQTWPYAAVISGRPNVSHLILRKSGEIVAVAQARIAQLPLVNIGIAYIRWGPLWRRNTTDVTLETFRQAIRALRNEYSWKRGLVLRLFPIIHDDDPPYFAELLAEEGFSPTGAETRSRTILMDLRPPVEALREGMKAHWKRELKLAERNRLEVIEGSSDELFSAFIGIYKEMVSRKRFAERNDITQFKLIHNQLPDRLKMKIMLCRSDAGICAGLVYSAIGRTAIYMFGATSNIGMKTKGSYLLHWMLIDKLKQDGCTIYDLNGINPLRNPGTYKFKNDLAGKNGRDVYVLGRFDATASVVGHWCVEVGDAMRTAYCTLRELRKTAGQARWRIKEAS